MNNHDEMIKKAKKEIDKLTSDIEKKKSRIAKLREDIKKYEAAIVRDNEFSNNFLKLLAENGVTSDEDRKEMISKIEELILTREIEKSENTPKPHVGNEEESAQASTEISEKTSVFINELESKIGENSEPEKMNDYQNPYQPKI